MGAQRKPSDRPWSVHPGSVIEDVARIVSEITGVQLGERQKTMVETRLRKRILDLGLANEQAYAHHFEANAEKEAGALVSLLTTHHTYFFREFAHFEALEKKVLPIAVEAARAQGRKKLRLWSAACSRGQEVYSLAMFLEAHLPRIAPGFTYDILGTDVDTDSVAIARNGVYHRGEIKEVPLPMLGNHWSRGTGDIADFVKAKPSLRANCRFEVANLISLPPAPAGGEFDVIFCRNVFIYFTPEQIKLITSQLLARLGRAGHLFIGISESLNGYNLPVSFEGPSIYAHKGESAPARKAALSLVPSAPAPAAPVRVLCVDDSPSVLAVLKKVLAREHGFEVVGTAKNGLEAAREVAKLKPDLVTLDIHMPEQTGLEYLQRNFGPSHPPVVMISSVSREDSGLAMQCLGIGASDFVEKPALSDMNQRGEEIRAKLHCALRAKSLPAPAASARLGLDRSFASAGSPADPARSLRAIVANFSCAGQLATLFKELGPGGPPSVIFVEGSASSLPGYAQAFSAKIGRSVHVLEPGASRLEGGQVYLVDFASGFESLLKAESARRACVMVYGTLSAHGTRALQTARSGSRLILSEDPGPSARPESKLQSSAANDVVPATSFAYMCEQYLGKPRD